MLDSLLFQAQRATQQSQWQQAINCYLQALEQQPTNQQYEFIYLKLALLYGQQQKLEPALKYFQKTIQYNPKNPAAHSGIGQILHRFEQLEQALQHYQQALTYNPSLDNFLLTAKTFHRLGRYQQAMLCYKEAAKINPQSAELNFSIALIQLLHGHYKEGWQRYEARWQLPDRGFILPVTKQPQWQGETLENKTLLIIHEQGFGDTIQFLRYLLLIKAQKLILKCHAPLISMVQTSFSHLPIDIVEPNTPILEIYDYYVPLASLPRLFQTQVDSIPHNIPYLKTNSAKIQPWKTKLTTGKINIGIVWSGNPNHVNDANRSCPLDYFLNLAQQTDIQLYSLQKGDVAQQLNPDMPIQDCSQQLQDFTDTAALIQALDLVITVDTSVAHLAGALGQKTWIILPYVPDWRWLLNRQDSPWYPTVKLFRQIQAKDWTSVFSQLQHELNQLIS
ncbi:tetratricopeptide repeat-containing glycosyltransferase family protein [Candidatus Albibeggiatoa sp. nov. NOAA]|uniref:tetratricopeptide repeat-containing glycosyltransferase family protein n=1 Tax=Candidatus Albibeggiatoa sp. nov. NOAA TaxID=3162724 RepID=UPI0032FCB7FB|nr:tetratricopeptide repeat protein [Thiotrichaceae bacterium]